MRILYFSWEALAIMSIPPFLLGPNPWATMMAQQQAQIAAAQVHAQAAAMREQAVAHAQMHAIAGPPLPQMPKQPEVLSEDKLQEKGNARYRRLSLHCVFYNDNLACSSSKMATVAIKAVCGEEKVRLCRRSEGGHAG